VVTVWMRCRRSAVGSAGRRSGYLHSVRGADTEEDGDDDGDDDDFDGLDHDDVTISIVIGPSLSGPLWW
jgi:hypothetical protein